MNWKILSLRALVGLFILAFAIACRADTDKDAAKTADNFLAALKIFELPEGKQAVAESSWSANLDKLPVLLEEEKLFEGMLTTDIPGVVGYKRLIQARVQSQGGSPLTEKYLLVSYKDQQMGKWKIWEFRKLSGTDVEHEIDAAKQEIGHSEYLKDQFTYRNYAYWLALGGRLLAAKKALETALALDRPHHEQYFDEQNCRAQINAIKLIGEATSSPAPQFVTIRQSVSIGTNVLPVGTRLELVSKEGPDVRIRYAGEEYVIPISATNLK